MAKNIRVHLTVEGKVQRVWYRDSTRTKAKELGIKGWVKNKADGCVEITAEGPEENIRKFVDWCYEGPPYAVVANIIQTPQEFKNEFSSFNIVF